MPDVTIYRKNKLISSVNPIKYSQPIVGNSALIPTPDIGKPTRVSNIVATTNDINTDYYKTVSDKRKGNQRIFIQIAAYRDPELIKTINNILEKADNPENLRFGICWQYNSGDDFDSDVAKFMNDNRFRFIKVPNDISHGTCWARHTIQHLYCEEEFTLAIDSHHRFVPHWDSELKSMYYYMQDLGHKKPLFTGYVTSYKPWLEGTDGTDNYTFKNGFEIDPWKMVMDRFIPEGAVFFLPASILKKEQQKPIPSRFYSAHFCFTTGQMCKEVPHDPNYYFHGEEISIAVRAYTHGYDLFHPHKIICYHEYTRKGRPHHWDDCNKKHGRLHDWWEVNEMCHKRNRILFGMDGEDPNQINFGEYGFGNVRTLEDYQRYAGVNFKERAISPECRDNITPVYPHFDNPNWENEWLKNWCIDFFIPWTELPKDYSDTEFWYVGIHDENGVELKRQDFDIDKISEIYDDRQDMFAARFALSLTCDSKPVSYTVIPHQKTTGWLDKIIKTIDLI